MHNTSITRRSFARYSGLSSLGALLSGWMPRLAAELAESGIQTKPPIFKNAFSKKTSESPQSCCLLKDMMMVCRKHE